MFFQNPNSSLRSSSRSSAKSQSKGKGISLSQNNYPLSNNPEQTLNINVYVDSISLKQPKININYILSNKRTDAQNKVIKRRPIQHQSNQTRTPLRNIQLNKSVYLNSRLKYDSPGISLSLLKNNNKNLKEDNEKIQYKRRSISIQQSKMFQTAVLHQQNLETPIKHKSTQLAPKYAVKTTPLKKPIFRHLTQY